ncbi:hypothetical protein [Anaerosinus sp.]
MKEDFNKGIIFSKGEKMPAPFNKNFSGQAYLEMLVAKKHLIVQLGM